MEIAEKADTNGNGGDTLDGIMATAEQAAGGVVDVTNWFPDPQPVSQA